MNLKRYFIFVEQTQCITLKRTKNMARPVTLCTLQWGDLPLDVICEKAKSYLFKFIYKYFSFLIIYLSFVTL